jgi:hypothetical protein
MKFKARKVIGGSYIKVSDNQGVSGKLIEQGANKGKYNKLMHVYEIQGDESVQAAYKKAVGDKCVSNDAGNGLFFTDSVMSDIIDLGIGQTSGRVFVDDSLTRNQVTLVNQYSGKLQDKMAELVAQRILDAVTGNATVATVTSVASVTVAPEAEKALDA